MNNRRIGALALAATIAATAGPAGAQADDRSLRDMMRACAQVAEVSARAACYDAIPIDEPAAPAPPVAAAPASPAAAFGSDQLPRTRAPEPARPAEIERIEAKVVEAVERQPGIHLLTLEGGAQWQFVEGVSPTYSPPRRGSAVEIRSASLGSYLLRFQGQPAVRVRRVR